MVYYGVYGILCDILYGILGTVSYGILSGLYGILCGVLYGTLGAVSYGILCGVYGNYMVLFIYFTHGVCYLVNCVVCIYSYFQVLNFLLFHKIVFRYFIFFNFFK